MKHRLKEIAENIWEVVCGIAGLLYLVFIFFLLCVLVLSAVLGAVWCIDKMFLGGVMFG
jgi:hypothetical protein